jgi:hypothetical protein
VFDEYVRHHEHMLLILVLLVVDCESFFVDFESESVIRSDLGNFPSIVFLELVDVPNSWQWSAK